MQGYVILGADFEYRLQKIVRSTSRDLWTLFVFSTTVRLFQKIEKKSKLAFLLEIICCIDSLEVLLSKQYKVKFLTDAQISEISIFRNFFVENFEKNRFLKILK